MSDIFTPKFKAVPLISNHQPKRHTCRFCRSEDEPLRSPGKNKRFEVLTCARCGNQIGVQYKPKRKTTK